MQEFTVILYAGGTNRLTSDLSFAKSLLPIGNRPLIWYTLEIIRSHPALSSSPLFILTSSQYRQALDDYLSTLDLNYELIISRSHLEGSSTANTTDDHHQSSIDDLGTLDILRSCYSRIRTESICLITCDLFGKIDLNPMINLFRVRDAALTMLLLNSPFDPTKDSLVQPGQKTKFTPGSFRSHENKEKRFSSSFEIETEFYIVDQRTDTVTSIRLKADLDDDLPMKQNVLVK